MKRIIMTLAIAISMASAMFAQDDRKPDNENEFVSITYRQADEVRKAFGLDSKQFDKVYKAYKTYNDAVFGAFGSAPQGPTPGRMGGPMGGPGRGGHNFGEGRPPMDGNHAPGARRSERQPNKQDVEKLEKTKNKQEDKLRKSMKKILKNEADYERWLTMRDEQLKMRPGKPNRDNELPHEKR